MREKEYKKGSKRETELIKTTDTQCKLREFEFDQNDERPIYKLE